MWPSSLSVFVLVVTMAVGVGGLAGTNVNVTQAQEFLDRYNTEAQQVFANNAEVNWVYNTNITTENQQNAVRPRRNVGLSRSAWSWRARLFVCVCVCVRACVCVCVCVCMCV